MPWIGGLMNEPESGNCDRTRERKIARVIAFSGVDCSGKSTQISILMERLRDRGERPVYVWLRVGYTPLFNTLKGFLRWVVGSRRLPQGESPQRERFMGSGWTRSLWLHVAFADMAFETALRIRLLRLFGRKVLCDRYLEDSERDLIMNFGYTEAQLPAWGLVKAIAAKPDVRIFLDLSFEESLRRSIEKKEPFADSEQRRLQRAGLYSQLKQNSGYRVVDAECTVAEIAKVVDSLVFREAADSTERCEVSS